MTAEPPVLDHPRYQLIDQLGRGGYGAVFACLDLETGQEVAVKQLVVSDEESIARFAKEVRLLSALEHPNIVKVLYSELSRTPPIFVMPRYHSDLRDELSITRGDIDATSRIYLQILDAFIYAHDRQILHRDIKPGNVLIGANTQVVIADFGLSRHLNSDSTRITSSGFGGGTDFYTAPEQFQDLKNADPRSDIYSLGILLYALYAGPIHTFLRVEELPRGMQVLVRKCVETKPEDRFSCVAELKEDWLRISDHQQYLVAELRGEKLLTDLSHGLEGIESSDVVLGLSYLVSKSVDGPYIYEACMKLTPSVFSRLEEIDSSQIYRIVKGLCKYISESIWQFKRTDFIADFLASLYHALSLYDTRSEITVCLLKLGISHSRWHVQKALVAVLNSDKEPGELLLLKDKLKRVDTKIRAAFLESEGGNLHQTIKALFVPITINYAYESNELWERFKTGLMEKSIPTYAIINQHVVAWSIENSTLYLYVRKEHFVSMIERKADYLSAFWNRINGRLLAIEVRVLYEEAAK